MSRIAASMISTASRPVSSELGFKFYIDQRRRALVERRIDDATGDEQKFLFGKRGLIV